jgi:hypothetical protein
MWIVRRVLAILAAVGVLSLVPTPAWAEPAANCALSERGAVYCWDRDTAVPVRVTLTGPVVQLVAAGDNTCALTDSGAVYCWGAKALPDYRAGVNPLVLVAIGALLVAGGTALLLVGRH